MNGVVVFQILMFMLNFGAYISYGGFGSFCAAIVCAVFVPIVWTKA